METVNDLRYFIMKYVVELDINNFMKCEQLFFPHFIYVVCYYNLTCL